MKTNHTKDKYMTPDKVEEMGEEHIAYIAEGIIQNHMIPDVSDSSQLYFEPDRDEIKQDIIEALTTLHQSHTQYHQDLTSEVVERLEGEMRTAENGFLGTDNEDESWNAALTKAQTIIKSLKP